MAVNTAKVSTTKVPVLTAKVAKVAIIPAKVAVVANQIVEAGRQLGLRRQVWGVGRVGAGLEKICQDWNTETSTRRKYSYTNKHLQIFDVDVVHKSFNPVASAVVTVLHT